ncbi:aromatic amino acid transaminase (plasmid) [Bartonella sp. HY329]|uniref:aromatic amino acid transaminase n=1 Tax=unclassified Bartonella TaxID=2645622 RepID=UPI0021C916B0|nr:MULTISPECIES: aromatic amino acid transaminase [unclassified Bartonella]UXM96577.1 aromatic amino acid transaminase [Bartonella sp. HY329]UXN10900.1 aromatic amino acid transaminase [Bartonella sp. HY328]
MCEFLKNYSEAAGDPILAIMDILRKDKRDNCIDLGVGVYRDDKGDTPIMQAVKLAEQGILLEEKTKTYLGIRGNIGFLELLSAKIFHSDLTLSSLQTPGGSGALRTLADFVAIEDKRTVWLPNPTWGNHGAIFEAAGHKLATYAYYNDQTTSLDFSAMLSDLGKAQKGDIVLLHGVCHNPTGVDLDAEQWQQVADLLLKKELIPFIDLAYLGFGSNLQEDLTGVDIITRTLPAGLVAISASKNFALYRERTGAAFVFSHEAQTQKSVQSQLNRVARFSYSMPPDHGAEIVRRILVDKTLYQNWHQELALMCGRINNLRKSLADELAVFFGPDRFAYIKKGKGMFSLLPLDQQAVNRLCNEFAIYIVPGGRMNIAGLKIQECQRMATAIANILNA